MSPQPTILIVDDEKHTRDGLRRLLENDYDVYVAPDLGGAMNVLKHEQIAVLRMDSNWRRLIPGRNSSTVRATASPILSRNRRVLIGRPYP